MAIREIITLPDPRLREVAEPVREVTGGIRALADDMLETMYDAPGIGLAATQVGEMVRLFVADVSAREEDSENSDHLAPMVFVNPEIVWSSPESCEEEEGCLSIPEVYGMVRRPGEITVRYLDREGVAQERHCTGILARCIQHEMDHLNGVLFIDHLSRLRRDRITKRFAKAKRLERTD